MALTYDELRTNAQKIVDSQIKERVLRGIEVLNAWDPDWPDYVDPNELLLESTSQCVLGQCFDTARPTVDQWDHYIESGPPTTRDLREMDSGRGVSCDGFTKALVIIDGDVAEDPQAYAFERELESYEDLTEAWLTVLTGEPEID